MKIQHLRFSESRAVTPRLFLLPPPAIVQREPGPVPLRHAVERSKTLFVPGLQERQRTQRWENAAFAVLALVGLLSVMLALIDGLSGGP